LAFFVIILITTSKEDVSDDLTACRACIGLFSAHVLFETSFSIIPVIFILIAFFWTFYIQPAVLNRCHLTLWMLIFDALRNVAVVEDHFSFAWGFKKLREGLKTLGQ
jgi:hypothetical protein